MEMVKCCLEVVVEEDADGLGKASSASDWPVVPDFEAVAVAVAVAFDCSIAWVTVAFVSLDFDAPFLAEALIVVAAS